MTISLLQVFDDETVRAALLKDNIYKGCFPTLNNVDLDFILTSYYLLFKDSKVIGMIILREYCANHIMIHGGIYKQDRGNSVSVIAECLKQIHEAYPNVTIMTTIAEHNKLAQRLMQKLNFNIIYVLSNATPSGDHLLFMKEER